MGTQFSTNGAWIEPTLNMRHTGTGVLPGLNPFSAKSEAEGSALGGFAVAQDLRAFDKPVTVGAGLFGTAGAGLSFNDVPASNGTSDVLSILTIATSVGVELTDRLNAGASLHLGTANLYGPFVGVSAAAYDYALRGSVGVTYDVADATTMGVYYQTKQSFNFDNAVRLQLFGGAFSTSQDINMDLPRNVGFGFADQSLMCGRLLLAADVLYKNWDDTALFGPLYDDQWVLQLGTQYSLNDRVRLRAGYVFAEDITEANPGSSAGGVTPPGLQNAIQYVQAQFPAINQHRISGGVGVRDLLPGLDADLFAGGMFNATENFGPLTSTRLQSYWIGMGLTWRFGRGHSHDLPVADDWCLQ
jgi:long-chain fatty acid transport protein